MHNGHSSILSKRIIALFGKSEVRITDSVTFCISNVFHNKYPFVLRFDITVTKRIFGGDLARCHVPWRSEKTTIVVGGVGGGSGMEFG